MERKYNKLFEPLKVGNTIVKNRIWTAPTLIRQVASNEYPNDQFIAYYMNQAKGGAAVVTIGETDVDWEYGKTHAGVLNLWGTEAAVKLANVADAIHRYGAKASIELCHGGVWAAPEQIGGKHPIGPIKTVRPDGVEVDEITEEQMEIAADRFAEACAILKKCGFDSAMIHGAHGWLIGSFVSPLDNHRTDKYGGSLENRARFPIMVLDRIRRAVGNDFNIEYRHSVDELVKGGITVEDSIAFLKMIEDKIDVIHESVGTRWDVSTRYINQPSCFMPYGCNLRLSKALKDAGLKKPVIAVGALDDPEVANRAIADGYCDGVAIARGLIADPEWPNKARRGLDDEIVPCIRCSKCNDAQGGRDNSEKMLRFAKFSTHRILCSVNPERGRETYPALAPAEEKRKVAVVGGGPAGMKAALTASQRGHKVTLYEQEAKLGGILRFAEYVDFKSHIKRYVDYLTGKIERSDIKVLLNTKATPKLLEQEGYDAVIVAIGGKKRSLQIPGADNTNVKHVLDVYGHDTGIGKHVVIVGAGQTGTEAAIYFLQQGHEVTLIASRDMIAHDAGFTCRMALVDRVNGKAEIFTNSRAIEITGQGVRVHNKVTGEEAFVYADTVILANGLDPRTEEALEFHNTAVDVYYAGDCDKIQNILYATKTAYDAATSI